jgi:cytochrome c553
MSTARLAKQLAIMAAVLCTSAVMAAPAKPTNPILAGKAIVLNGNDNGAIACKACHRADGEGNAEQGYPMLAGLNAHYIEKQLHDFKHGLRQNPIMNTVAGNLSKQDIKDVAAYFSSLKPTLENADPSTYEIGEELATKGDAADKIPSCFSCHGQGARGVGTMFPAIAGQHASYIATQLRNFKGGSRRNDPNDMMGNVAKHLTDGQIEAVSVYISSLNPAH